MLYNGIHEVGHTQFVISVDSIFTQSMHNTCDVLYQRQNSELANIYIFFTQIVTY